MIEKWIKNDLTRKRWRRFKKHKFACASALIIGFLTILTFFSPIIANSRPIVMSYQGTWYFPVVKDYGAKEFGITASLLMDYRELELNEDDWAIWPVIKWDPFESNRSVDFYPAPPSSDNLFGTDDRGRDVLTRLLYGYKYSILYAVCVWFLTFVVGSLLGAVMGFFGGRVDLIGQRLVEIFSTVPQFFLLIILISIFSPNLWWLIAISTVFGWIPISYYVRGEFLKNRQREYVEAARSMGARKRSIIVKHILPNSLTPIITFSPFVIASNIIGLASLDYLGFGLEVPTPSWGELLSQANQYYSIAWWLAVFPSIALFLVLTMLNLIGDGVRDAMDPNIS